MSALVPRGGGDNLPSVKDLEHEVHKEKEKRLKMEGGDATAMMAYFDRMQEDNQNFYRAHRLDEEGRLKDVMWVDARSRVSYEEFGDVVCFDATYLTNEYELPFANFVGVNHHGQSILLGGALVSHEDSDTFSWVFRQWMSCMGNKEPGAILTDQAAAMRKPLEQVMPNARHRWCIWHILKKFPDKLGKCEGYDSIMFYFDHFKYYDMNSPLKTLIYESFTVGEFERRWSELMSEYNLHDTEWLFDLYDERHMWVPAFMKEHFWARMKTTQRVESINSFFDGFVNRKTKLYEFPDKYKKAMERRVKAEKDADARCRKYLRRLFSVFYIVKFFQEIYTYTKFQEIQTECTRLMHCSGRDERVLDGNLIQYLLEDKVWIIPEGISEEEITDRWRFDCIIFKTVTKDVSCDCRKFETFDVIRVYDQNLVFNIPSKYVIQRWRKDVARKHTRVKVAYHDPTDNSTYQSYNKLMEEFDPIC
ncbi:protein FAR-RED IMPAIRED RESPONSE 1-like [Chenopodium quinoa]|uniref:protein FAR-RED IMPAIRED RESPONSE 1-like n=1 Tax=Chenopodium quinoa TaxID=63459 RepID=UPI000B776295|nr:protein FAR-RED IMPAIRED RESPONSE 1-like [Chenopodium quinoa]